MTFEVSKLGGGGIPICPFCEDGGKATKLVYHKGYKCDNCGVHLEVAQDDRDKSEQI